MFLLPSYIHFFIKGKFINRRFKYMKYPLKTVTNSVNRLDIEKDNIEGNYKSIIIETSSCLNIENITQVFNLESDREQRTKLHRQFRERLQNINNIPFATKAYVKELQEYNNQCLNAQEEIVTQFVKDCRNGDISIYFTVQYNTGKNRSYKNGTAKQKKIVEKNIIFTFNNEKFISLTGVTTGWDEYATAYRHFFCLIFILNLGFNAYQNRQLFYSRLHNKVQFSVLSGMKVNCTFGLGGGYGSLFEELSQLIPLNTNEMNFKIDRESQIFDITIKDSSFLSRAYSAYINCPWNIDDVGKKITLATSNKVYTIKKSDVRIYDYNEYLDNKDISSIRITRGEAPNEITVRVELTGMRIVSRIVKSSANTIDKVYSDKLFESFTVPDDMIACLLWRIIWRTKQWDNEEFPIERSSFNVYSQFIKENEGSRNVAKQTAVIILLSQKSEQEREIFINKYFDKNASKQKAKIRAGLEKLDKMLDQASKKDCEIFKFVGGLKNNYAW